MRKTDIRIHGKTYQVICADDQTDHVCQLGEEIDARAQKVAAGIPHANETMLLLLTCLMLADELYEARTEAGALHEKILRSHHDLGGLLPDHSDEEAGQRIDGLLGDVTKTLENLTRQIQHF